MANLREPSGRRRGADGSSAAPFGLRLALAILVTFGLLGLAGYTVVADQLERQLVHSYAIAQAADIETFEAADAREDSDADALREIDEVLDAIARRPGTVETLIIDRGRVVRASGDHGVIGTKDSDERIDAAIDRGESYAGAEADPASDQRNFEFVAPVDLRSGRYAFEVSYDGRVLAAQVSDVRRTLALLGLLALVAGGGVFYVLGGRTLMRSHRIALQRATRDGLTDLPNQRAFHDEIAAAVAAAGRHAEPLTLAMIDIDDFKFLNDRYGHPRGDALLRQLAAILSEGRGGDRAYRIGGDEFALLLSHTDGDGARRLTDRLSRRFAEAGIRASVGVGELRPGQAADALIGEADAALYEVKRQGGHAVLHFDDVRDRVALTTPEKIRAVRDLIDEGCLATALQPIWDLRSGRLLGLEALMRPDESYGLFGPAEAFEIANQIGRVHELDEVCIARALAMAPEIPHGVLLFLNIAPQTLDLDAERAQWLGRAVEGAGLLPENVVIEVTERFQGRTASIIKSLRLLREQGFKLAIDDVGAGNAGLEMLREVGAEFVKIDRGIIVAAPTEQNARGVLRAMATFARQTGAFVIAEGIEGEETLEFLRELDHGLDDSEAIVQGGQGFGLGRPTMGVPSTDPPLLRTTVKA